MLCRIILSVILIVLIAGQSPGEDRITIGILDLEAGGVSTAEAVSITNRIRNELFLTGRYKVVERGAMQEILTEVGFQMAGCTTSECIVQAGRILGVQQMVAGSLDKLGQLYTINLRMINVETGEILAVASADCQGAIEEVALKSTKEVVWGLVGTSITAPSQDVVYSSPDVQTPLSETEGDKKFRLAILLLDEDKPRAMKIMQEVVDDYGDCGSADDALYFLLVSEEYEYERAKERLLILKAYYPNSPRIAEAEKYIERKEEVKLDERRKEGDHKFTVAQQLLTTDKQKALEMLKEVVDDYRDCESADDALYLILVKEEYDYNIAELRLQKLKAYYPESLRVLEAEKYIEQKEQEKFLAKRIEGDNKFKAAQELLEKDRPRALAMLKEIVVDYKDCESADDALFCLITNTPSKDDANGFLSTLKTYYPVSPYIETAEDIVENWDERIDKVKEGNDKFNIAKQLIYKDITKFISLMQEVVDNYWDCDSADVALYYLITKGNNKNAEKNLLKLKANYPDSPIIGKAEKHIQESTIFDESDFVLLPGGSFRMGSISGQVNEKPVHIVEISPFKILKMEITQAQWQKVLERNPSKFKGENLPVENVSWDEIMEFIRRLNNINPGENYRLPSEAEWEYACKAGSESKYCFGDDEFKLIEYAWCRLNSEETTHTVMENKPNRWGLFDMHGNVSEWCADSYSKNYKGAPNDGKAWIIKNNPEKVVRGGSCNDKAIYCTSSNRKSEYSWIKNKYIGFRLVKSAE